MLIESLRQSSHTTYVIPAVFRPESMLPTAVTSVMSRDLNASGFDLDSRLRGNDELISRRVGKLYLPTVSPSHRVGTFRAHPTTTLRA